MTTITTTATLKHIEFEIHDTTTNEILVDKLQFDDIAELVGAYQLLYPTHDIAAVYREVEVVERVRHLPKQQFKAEWFNLIDDIIDNLYNS